MARYDERARETLAEDFERDGFVLLPSHFSRATLETWRAVFSGCLSPMQTRRKSRVAAAIAGRAVLRHVAVRRRIRRPRHFLRRRRAGGRRANRRA